MPFLLNYRRIPKSIIGITESITGDTSITRTTTPHLLWLYT